jgi:hypothetical protein
MKYATFRDCCFHDIGDKPEHIFNTEIEIRGYLDERGYQRLTTNQVMFILSNTAVGTPVNSEGSINSNWNEDGSEIVQGCCQFVMVRVKDGDEADIVFTEEISLELHKWY